MHYQERITLEPGKHSGKLCLRGLRIAVHDVLKQLATGLTIEEIIDDFPELESDDFLACLQFTADQADWRESA